MRVDKMQNEDLRCFGTFELTVAALMLTAILHLLNVQHLMSAVAVMCWLALSAKTLLTR